MIAILQSGGLKLKIMILSNAAFPQGLSMSYQAEQKEYPQIISKGVKR
jgi:hypothetical protein